MGKKKQPSILIVSAFSVDKVSNDTKTATILSKWAKEFDEVVLLGDTFNLTKTLIPSESRCKTLLGQILKRYPKTLDAIQRNVNINVISGAKDIGLSRMLYRTSDIIIFEGIHIQYTYHKMWTNVSKYRFLKWLTQWIYIPSVILDYFTRKKQLRAVIKMARLNGSIKTFVFAGSNKRFVREVLVDGKVVRVVNVGSYINSEPDVTILDTVSDSVVQNKVIYPERINKILKYIQPGDILLSFNPSYVVSQLIANVTNANWSHVMIYHGNGRIYEATGHAGVHSRLLDHYLDGNFNLLLLRPYNQKLVPKVLKWISRKVGSRYAFVQLFIDLVAIGLNKVLFFLKKDFRKVFTTDLAPNDYVCSELVAQAYYQTERVEIAPGVPPQNIEPYHFPKSPHFFQKGILIYKD